VSAGLFLIFCQRGVEDTASKIANNAAAKKPMESSSYYRTSLCYAEHAFALQLLALCRVLAALFCRRGQLQAAASLLKAGATGRRREEEKEKKGTSLCCWGLDVLLSLASALISVGMCATLVLSTQDLSSVVTHQQWILGAKLPAKQHRRLVTAAHIICIVSISPSASIRYLMPRRSLLGRHVQVQITTATQRPGQRGF
jgi:hypothetical protein